MTVEAPVKGRVTGAQLDQAIIEWQYEHREKLSMADLANRAGVSVDFLYRLRRNDLAQLRLDRLQALCDFLGCTPNDLLWQEIPEDDRDDEHG